MLLSNITNIAPRNKTVANFSGTGAQTAFTLPLNPGTVNNTEVYISGVYQQKSTYSVSGTALTFSSPPPSGTNNIEVEVSSVSLNIPADKSVSTDKLTPSGTAGQILMSNGISASPFYTNGFVSSFIDMDNLLAGSQTTLVSPNLICNIGGAWTVIPTVIININATTYWDNSTYATSGNRAGKDFYIYGLSNGSVILSANSSIPTGYTANNSRKIGGFHTLCLSVGTISEHTLTGYNTGDILPNSVWCSFNKPRCSPEGMTKSIDGNWIDIYLPSWNGTQLVSVFGGTTADGGNGWHTYKFEQRFGMIGKKCIRQTEFVVASLGSNQGTNISGSGDPGTTGGHSDTANRRMISNIGCEDMCGVLWQWGRDTGSINTGASWVDAYDSNDTAVSGQHYEASYRVLLGGDWSAGVICGSRGSGWPDSPLALISNFSGRGVCEPANFRF